MLLIYFNPGSHQMSKPKQQVKDQGPPIWDALNGVSAAVSNCSLILVPLAPYLKDKEFLDRIEDKNKFYRLVQTLDQDLRAMTQRLNGIRDRHAGRTGQTKNADETVWAIEIQEDYVQWAGDFDDVVVPVFSKIVEMLQQVGVSNISIPSATAVVGSTS